MTEMTSGDVGEDGVDSGDRMCRTNRRCTDKAITKRARASVPGSTATSITVKQ